MLLRLRLPTLAIVLSDVETTVGLADHEAVVIRLFAVPVASTGVR